MFRLLKLLTFATFPLALTIADACTSMLLKTADDSYVYGRTMEFGFQLDSEGVVLPRNMEMKSEVSNGLVWTSKYAVVGMNAFGLPIVCDGMNETGMAAGILYFPGYAEYLPLDHAIDGKGLAPWEFLTWALSQFSTVDEIKAALDGVQIVHAKLEKMGICPPFHYTFHDAQGNSIVIEPLNGGELVVYDNPYGTMTNAPTFDWHLTNIKNYITLTPYDAPPMDLDGNKIPAFGSGTGWIGLPGDPTPPARFLRALAFSMTSNPLPSGIRSVRLVEHIMNNFDIPYGTIRDRNDQPMEYTQWTTIADMKNLVYYAKTYNNQRLHSIDFADFDLNAKQPIYAAIPDNLAATPLFDK